MTSGPSDPNLSNEQYGNGGDLIDPDDGRVYFQLAKDETDC